MHDEDVPRFGAGGRVDTDTAFELVGHSRRRALLRLLSEMPDRTWHVASLASEAVARGPTWAGSPETRDVVVSLHHIHLPRLAEAGLLSYDPRSRTVADVDGEAIEALFETVDRETTDRGLV
jgi:hypothetical protein